MIAHDTSKHLHVQSHSISLHSKPLRVVEVVGFYTSQLHSESQKDKDHDKWYQKRRMTPNSQHQWSISLDMHLGCWSSCLLSARTLSIHVREHQDFHPDFVPFVPPLNKTKAATTKSRPLSSSICFCKALMACVSDPNVTKVDDKSTSPTFTKFTKKAAMLKSRKLGPGPYLWRKHDIVLSLSLYFSGKNDWMGAGGN